MLTSRRALLSGLSGLIGAACSKGSATNDRGQAAGPPGPGWHDLTFAPSELQPDGQRAAVFAPPGSTDWPALVALHGRGEAGRGLEAGARGWRDDYDLDLVRERMAKGEIASADTKDMHPRDRLQAINASLAKNPWVGLVLICPYTPVPAGRSAESARAFGRFVVESLLPRVGELRGAPLARDKTGIDGVSMGGRYALQLGFSFAEHFASVGSMQPALQPEEAGSFASMAGAASKHVTQQLHLVSSEEDPFLEATRALDSAYAARGLKHQLIVTSGPHDYVWNRGPGATEMLFFHERALRGLAT